jgi:hypothetical protein
MKVSHEETWLAPGQGKVIEIQTKWGAQFKGYLCVLRVSANQSVYKACEEKQRAGERQHEMKTTHTKATTIIDTPLYKSYKETPL